MIRYFARALGAHYRAGRTLFFLGLFGVALGVASVLSIQIINLNALGAFEGSVRAVGGEADLSIVGRTPTLAESDYVEVLATPGVAAAWPMIRVDVALEGRDEYYLDLVGVDLFAPVRMPWEGESIDISRTLAVPGWVAITPELAAEHGWVVGDGFEISSGTRRARLEIGALIDFRRVTPLAGRKMIVMDISQAQSILGLRGRVGQIDVVVADDAEPMKVAQRLQSRLGDGAPWARHGARS
jgi:putative ABC transport system permease protein